MTKIFCDIADINLIKKFDRKKIVKGFTTNPSLMRKAGAKDYQNYSKKILRVTKKPISFEVFADNHDEMIKQGNKISKWGKNVYVKVPVVNSKKKLEAHLTNGAKRVIVSAPCKNADKTIVLASNSTDNTVSEDGGIILKGTSDHSILWTSDDGKIDNNKGI